VYLLNIKEIANTTYVNRHCTTNFKTMKNISTLFLGLCLLVGPTAVSAQDGHTQDSLALVGIYYDMNGLGWSHNDNWLTSHSIATWYGVTVDSTGRVTKLNLGSNSLKNKLSASFGDLSQLKELNLAYNEKLSAGPIPASLGRLQQLEVLNLSDDHLNGEIPDSLGNLVKLETLDLGLNQSLGGSIPSSIGNLTQVVFINLSGDQLNGQVPSFLGNLSKLISFYARSNYFSGPIPEALASLPVLYNLDFGYNQLSGSLPAALGLHKLSSLDLTGNNLLSGPIPDEIVNHKYTLLGLGGNSFTLEKIEGLIKSYPNTLMPQSGIPLHRTGNQLSITAGGTLSACTYNWYKNGGYYTSKKGDSILALTEPGLYEVQVYDSIINHYTNNQALLYSTKITVDALPLRLLSFTGTLAKASVALQWQTTDEDNTSAFEVQRVMPLTPPEALGTIEAANTQGAHLYKFIDNAPLPGTNYYRLKMIDKDGQVNYSNIISVKTTDDAVSLQLLPNPVQNSVSLSFTAPAGAYCIDIADVEGRRLKQICGVAANGVNRLAIDVHSYAQGAYFIMVTDKDGRKQSVQMIKGR